MRTIQFNKDELVYTVKTAEKPVLNIIRAVFTSSDPNWFQRLLSSSLTLKTVCYDKDDKVVYSSSQILVLGSYITPYHRQPVLEINYTENFQVQFTIEPDRLSYWKTTIELSGIQFDENETMTVSVMERSHILKRVADWKSRIDHLYSDISSWLSNKQDYSCKIGHPTLMLEDLMRTFEIPQQRVNTLDIFYKQKIVLAFKPKGLWIIGANGRIDILSGKGSFMLVDSAEQFQQPIWKLLSTDKKTKSSFNQEVFQQALSLTTQ